MVATEHAQPPSLPTLNTAECEVLFAHVFAVVFVQQQATLPPEERPTQEDVDRAQDELRRTLLGQCIGATRAELQYDCALAAKDVATMRSCALPTQTQ